MEDLNLTWEEKVSSRRPTYELTAQMAATQAIHVAREKALEELGITVDKDMVGVHAPQKFPSLVNLNEDPLMSECLVYQLKPGTTVVGNLESTSTQIKLSGEHITAEHCRFINAEGHVTLEACEDARTFVSRMRVIFEAKLTAAGKWQARTIHHSERGRRERCTNLAACQAPTWLPSHPGRFPRLPLQRACCKGQH